MTHMIHENQLIDALLSACHDMTNRWNEHLEFWGDDERGHYNDIAEFSHYVVDQFKLKKTEDFEAIFEVIEKAIAHGSDGVRGIAVVGFLEGVQNISSHTEFGPTVFEQWFGEHSQQAWAELNALWEGKSTLEEVIKSQK